MRILLTLCVCVEFLTLWNRLLLVCCHEIWHDDLYYRRYDHHHGKYSDSELMVDVINNLGLNILMVHNKDNDNNIAFSPYGAAVILIALGEGLQGEALYEIRKTLQLPYDGHTIRVGLRDIHRHLKTYFIPREGFLAGITLNSENVSIKPKYIDLLRFYGYDINSFNTALYPETHMTTEMTTMAGREETTIASSNTIESTTSTKVSGEETTSNVEGNEETTTPIKTTTSELQTTVLTTSQGETTSLSTELPTPTTEEVKPSVTTENIIVAQSSTNANSEKISTSKFPHTTSSLPQSDNLITTTTSTTSSNRENVITSTLSDIFTTLQQSTYSDLENIVTSTTENFDGTSSTAFQQITDTNSEIDTIPTTNKAPGSTTLLTFTELATLSPQQTANADLENIFISTTENVAAITNQFQQTTNNNSEFITKPITTSIPTTYETTLSTQQFTDPVTSTTDNYEKSTSQVQQSTNNVSESITTPITNEPETSDIPITDVFVDSTEIEASTEEIVTQPSSSEAGTVEAFSIENTNNITLVVNNQTFFVTRPSGKATNISVNVRTSTVSSDDDLSTIENIQSRNMRSVKSDKIDDLSNENDKNTYESNGNNSLSNETTSRNKINADKRYSFLGHETNYFDDKLNGTDFMAQLFSAIPQTKTKKEYINSEKTGQYQKIFQTHNCNNGVKDVIYGKKVNRKYIGQTTMANSELDICDIEIQINNTIYITDNQNNLISNIPKTFNELTRAKLTHDNYQQIRNPRSVNDYIMTRQYDRPNHFRPAKPYLPQEPPYFLVGGNKESNLDFMTYDTVLPFLHIQHLGALALAFPLDSDKYYLLLLLPTRNNGLDELICNIRNQNIFKYIINNLQLTHVKATIPSFNLKGRITLTNTLQKLGIRKIFQPRQADFTPMTDDENIYVTNIEQAVSVNIKNYMNFHKSHRYGSQHYYTDPVRFEVHRPFLYFVIDSEQQVLLMAGKVVNPLNIRIK